jgi:transposase
MLSDKERRRLIACERVAAEELSVTEAAGLLGISVRQMRRSLARHGAEGDAGLVHGLRGRASNRGAESSRKARVLARYAERYEGFGPTLAAEKLASEGLEVHRETLRRWLIEQERWKARPRRVRHRSSRPRLPHFGELVQIDGSPHDWFEGRRGRCCLMQMVDDATGVREMLLSEGETTEAAMRLLVAWIERHGVPAALYSDHGGVYVVNRAPTIDEQLEDRRPLSAFGAACERLGIAIITASSPQAKGRVERANGVAQDRLVKELRLAGASTIEQANELIASGWLDEINARFGREPAEPRDFHRPLRRDERLSEIFAVRTERTVAADFTIRLHNRFLQIIKQPGLPRPKEKVIVAERLDGSLAIEFRGHTLLHRDVTDVHRATRPSPTETRPPRSTAHAPAADHPWKRSWQEWQPAAMVAAGKEWR